jgi:hypothetical protein
VVELLEEIASPVALPALLARQTDDRPEVQAAARQAIEKINPNKNCVVPTRRLTPAFSRGNGTKILLVD